MTQNSPQRDDESTQEETSLPQHQRLHNKVPESNHMVEPSLGCPPTGKHGTLLLNLGEILLFRVHSKQNEQKNAFVLLKERSQMSY